MGEAIDLTIIIPFLNEKEEVENTLKSIREHSDAYIPILLIDDASDDGYDYESVARKYGAQYEYNKERKGVAASRDMGVELCQTTYFLLLDSHMRFYENKWPDRLLSLLKEDDRALFCAQTKVLCRMDGEIVEVENALITYGAYIDVLGEKGRVISSKWIGKDSNPEELVVEIPCVLGAAYATSKRYWQYLHGLRGLIFYGCDEEYISLKVWKEGGRCLFIKDIIIGHIYRKEAPYVIDPFCFVYNKLLIAELLLPYMIKKRLFVHFEASQKEDYMKAMESFSTKREEISSLKLHLRSISSRSDEEVLHMQNNGDEITSYFHSIWQILAKTGQPNSWGLSEGKAGLAVTLFKKASLSEQEFVRELICELFKDLPELIQSFSLSASLGYGWCGIGWAISYFIHKNILSEEYASLLPFIDQCVMQRDPRRIRESDFEKGLAGVLYYVMYRIENQGVHNSVVFDNQYLQELEEVTNDLFLHAEGIDSVEVLQVFLQGCKKGKYAIELLEEPDLYYCPGKA